MPDSLSAVHIGVLVNPIAGMGGTLALHGTDGQSLEQALSLGAVPTAHLRMARALSALRAEYRSPIRVTTARGLMGEKSLSELDWPINNVLPVPDVTNASNTKAVAKQMEAARVDLLLFAGGDGTAVDLAETVGTRVTLLGVPSGVKMHSPVFGFTPEAAGKAAAMFLRASQPRPVRVAEVIDVSGDGHQAEPRQIGTASVPRVATGIQGAKMVRRANSDGEIIGLGRDLAEHMTPHTPYIVGPGLTAGSVLEALKIEGSRNGFDVVISGKLYIRDATEQQLFDVLNKHARAELVLGVVGGQGFLLGRGNQQLSPRVLKLVGEENVTVVAAKDKIEALQPPVLHIDADQGAERHMLAGYRRVRTSAYQSTVLRIES